MISCGLSRVTSFKAHVALWFVISQEFGGFQAFRPWAPLTLQASNCPVWKPFQSKINIWQQIHVVLT